MKHSFSIIVIIAIINLLNAQIAVGEWRDHLAYNKAIRIAEGENVVYCATESALFYYNRNDNSINTLSKVNGLSDIGVKSIAYSDEHDVLLIAYSNANIDLLMNNTIYNISDIKRKQIIGNKTINNIHFIDNLAYLSCGFGIVVLDITKKEIKDSYYIGNQGTYINVNEITSDATYLYAATEYGIYKGELANQFLVNFENWDRIESIPNYDENFNTIKSFNGNLYFNYSSGDYGKDTVYGYNNTGWWYLDTLTFYGGYVNSIDISYDKIIICAEYLVVSYDENESRELVVFGYSDGSSRPKHAAFDEYGQLWIADSKAGMFKRATTGTYDKICPNGPVSNDVWNMDVKNKRLLVSAGSVNGSWDNTWNPGEINSFENELWTSMSRDTDTTLQPISDIVNVVIDPSNSTHFYAASWSNGLLEFNNNNVETIFNETNSSTQPLSPGGSSYRVFGVDYDSDNNLWVTNSGVESPISVLTSDGDWFAFEYGSYFSNSFIGDIIVTQNNHKWVLLPRGQGLFAFDDKGTFDNINDDDYKSFSVLDENGAGISNDLYAIAEDLDGAIWLGTNKGIVVYYQPENVFSGDNFYGQQIIIELDGNVQYLLESETVTSIVVDGANRKWIGTQDGGLFLMSDDGTEQLLKFNEDNSPLISNNIKCLALDDETGELFIGTSKGVISYRSTATKGNDEFDQVYVFPNPVKEDYTGLITVTGLVSNSNVKITDISGNIVYETTAFGGQAIWDGNDFNGARVHTGVYLVFCTNEDGTKTHITKLLFIN